MAEKGREATSCRARSMSVYPCLEITMPTSFPLVFRRPPSTVYSPRIPSSYPSMDPAAEHFIYVTQVYFCGT